MARSKPKSEKSLLANRFELTEELGRGGGGVVYLALDKKMGDKEVALKVLDLKKKPDAFLRETLIHEFETLTHLKHPHLAQVHDFGSTASEIYFSSDYIPGKDILTALGEANLNVVFQTLLQVLRALDYLHQRGVLHLDLKPANILVTEPEKAGKLAAKLIDFGLAHIKNIDRKDGDEVSGSPPYAAPEILLGHKPSPASDLYSLGIIFHELFAGKLPFKSQNPMAILQEQLYGGEVLPVDSLNPALPDAFARLLQRMVAKRPEERFASARQLLTAINECLGENFSLRSEIAPVAILEESDHYFREDFFAKRMQELLAPNPKVVRLGGKTGSGISRLLRRLKETLQLQGHFPLLLSTPGDLDRFLQGEERQKLGPLLIDLKEISSEQQGQLENLLKEGKIPALLAVEATTRPWPENFSETSIPDLKDADIRDFFQSEVADPPDARTLEELAGLSSRLPFPSELEKILQALREAGALQWGDQGWRWQGQVEIEIPRLLLDYESRWAERLRQIQEILRFSPVGLSEPSLSRMLGLEAGFLELRLQQWARENLLMHQEEDGEVLYQGKEPPSEGQKNVRDWNWLEAELNRLYEAGQFKAGAEWAEFLLGKNKAPLSPPASVRMLCARHWVAQGQAERCLEVLPSPADLEGSEKGLCLELEARAEQNLGKLEPAFEKIGKAISCYEGAQDSEGLARAFNLKGSNLKKRAQFKEAEIAYQKASEIGQKLRKPYIQGMAEMNLGTLFHDQGAFDQAVAIYEKVLALTKTEGHPYLACILRHNWINLLYHMGRSSEAESACYDCLKLSIQNRYPEQQAAALNYLALLAGQADQTERQIHFLHQAIALVRPLNIPAFLTQLLVNRAHAYCFLKKFTPAQLDSEETLELSRTQAGTGTPAWAHRIMGQVLRDRPRPDLKKAEEHLDRAWEISKRIQNPQLTLEIEFERGLLAKKKKDLEAARAFFLSAQEQLKQMMDKIPQHLRLSFLRDRKLERIEEALESLLC